MARIWESGIETGSLSIFDVSANCLLDTGTTAGAWSTYSIRSNATGGAEWTNGSTVAGGSDLFLGFRIRYPDSVASSQRICTFKSSTPAVQCSLYQSASQLLEARLGDGGTLLGTGTTTFSINTWYYVECRVRISDTVGQFEVRVNGNVTPEINVSAVDTRNDGASDNIARILVANSGGTNPFFDDIYVNDSTGPANTGFSGDIQIKGYPGNAAGDVTTLTRGGADSGSNFGQTDEKPPNDVTDYVFAADATSYDLYNVAAVSADFGTVQSARLWVRAQKSGGGSANIAHIVKYDSDASGTADTEAAGSDIALSTSWTYYAKEYNQHPDATNWSPTKADALQIGVKSR